jgi:hypothetical protein
MGVVPTNRVARIEFYEAHIAPWTAAAGDIGLTVGEIANITALTEAARASYLAAEEAREASKAATQTFYNAVSQLGKTGSGLIDTIRVYAEANNNPNVYSLAQIPPPSSGSPIPAPGIPFQPVVTLSQTGAIALNWKCTNPSGASGTIYEVRRQIGSGSFVFVGATGTREFIDDTIPAGSSIVNYQVNGLRSTVRGPVATFNVRFGVGGGGGLTVVDSTPAEVKIAA